MLRLSAAAVRVEKPPGKQDKAAPAAAAAQGGMVAGMATQSPARVLVADGAPGDDKTLRLREPAGKTAPHHHHA